MTELEAINQAIVTLDRINVPAYLIEQIGVPICNVSNLLKQLHKAIEEAKNKNEQEVENAQPEPEGEVQEDGRNIDAE